MNRNTRKFIWNGFWSISFFIASMLKLSDIRDWKDWAIFGIGVLLAAIYANKVEETFKED